MKDVSNTTNKAARLSMYPKKRPSPVVRDGGVAKVRRTPAHGPLAAATKRTPAPLELRKLREAQVLNQLRDTRLLEEEYRYEILQYMHDMERSTMGSVSSMDQQPEIRWHMRPFLVDFLVEVHLMFRLRPETLYLTLNIVDRYVSRRIVYTKHYQLVGCAALWIAAKFEDAKERVPTVHELADICRNEYEESAFIQMEQHVLDTIQWIVGHPTAESWLRLACCESFVDDAKIQHVARFLMELTLFHREFVSFTPSAVALGALLLARFTCGKPRRPFEETDEALQIVELLDNYLASNSHDISETLIKKYSFAYHSKASTHILQFYLEGHRFIRQPLPMLPPSSPTCQDVFANMSLSCVHSPKSASSMSSVDSDDMPITPMGSSDPFTVATATLDDKENILPPSMQMHTLHPSPVKHLPEEGTNATPALAFGRPKLNAMNRTAIMHS